MEDDSPIIAIDFGSSYSRVGVWQNDKVQIIPNKKGKKEIPSYITILDDEILVGDLSKIQSNIQPRRTIFNFKRLIGIKYPYMKENYKLLKPYKIRYENGLKFEIITYKKHEIKLLAIEEICALIFEKLKKRAIKFLGKEVKNAIITVPANFNITKRQIIQDSAKIAGLNVKKFIIESTAVAISYFYEKNIENEKKILFLNLGADFLSISIVLIKNNFFKVLATHGKNRFGGEDFDDILMLNKAFDSAFLKTPKYLNKLKNLCEEAKIKLSNSNEAIIEFKDFGKYSNYLNPEKFERYLFE